MIVYSKSYYGLGLLFRLYGSALPRSMPFALVSAGICWYLNQYQFDYIHKAWRHPFPYQIFGYIIGFIVVFRNQWAYQRYNEGRHNVQTMAARWSDACALALSFDCKEAPTDGAGAADLAASSQRFQDNLLHFCSLLHGLALQHLRGDWDLHNLRAHDFSSNPPPNDAAYVSRKAYKHNFIVDAFALHSSMRHRLRFNKAMPIRVIGEMTPLEVATLGGRSFDRGTSLIQDVSITGSHGAGLNTEFGADYRSGSYIPGAAERVNIALGWLYKLLAARRRKGGLDMDAPILSNIWARLGDGMHAYEQCRMLADTPFPAPWAQLLMCFLLAYTFTLPLLIAAFIDDTVIAVTITFIACHTYWALNEVARDLEDPFVFDPNDLPLARLQYLFNERLLQSAAAILHDRPRAAHVEVPEHTALSLGQRISDTSIHGNGTLDGDGLAEPLLAAQHGSGAV